MKRYIETNAAIRPLLFILFTLVLSSCLSTLYPIFHVKDLTFQENLLGLWKGTDKDGKISFLEFTKIPESRKSELPENIGEITAKAYFVSKINALGELSNQYFVFLVTIDDNTYLDYYPAELASQKEVATLYRAHFLKMHTNYKIDIRNKNHFEVQRFDQGFIDRLIRENKINIRHEVVDGRNIITASTDELQDFIIKYSNNPQAYGGDITYFNRISN